MNTKSILIHNFRIYICPYGIGIFVHKEHVLSPIHFCKNEWEQGLLLAFQRMLIWSWLDGINYVKMQGISADQIMLRIDDHSENDIIYVIFHFWKLFIFVYSNLLCSVMNFCDSFGYYAWNKDKKCVNILYKGRLVNILSIFQFLHFARKDMFYHKFANKQYSVHHEHDSSIG